MRRPPRRHRDRAAGERVRASHARARRRARAATRPVDTAGRASQARARRPVEARRARRRRRRSRSGPRTSRRSVAFYAEAYPGHVVRAEDARDAPLRRDPRRAAASCASPASTSGRPPGVSRRSGTSRRFPRRVVEVLRPRRARTSAGCCSTTGSTTIALNVRADNAAAIRSYEKLGFAHAADYVEVLLAPVEHRFASLDASWSTATTTRVSARTRCSSTTGSESCSPSGTRVRRLRGPCPAGASSPTRHRSRRRYARFVRRPGTTWSWFGCSGKTRSSIPADERLDRLGPAAAVGPCRLRGADRRRRAGRRGRWHDRPGGLDPDRRRVRSRPGRARRRGTSTRSAVTEVVARGSAATTSAVSATRRASGERLSSVATRTFRFRSTRS